MNDQFLYGAIVGLLVMFVVMQIEGVGYRRMLRDKARTPYRTAECIFGEFFYIVPEKEYNELNLLRHSFLAAESRVGWPADLDLDIAGRPLKPGT